MTGGYENHCRFNHYRSFGSVQLTFPFDSQSTDQIIYKLKTFPFDSQSTGSVVYTDSTTVITTGTTYSFTYSTTNTSTTVNDGTIVVTYTGDSIIEEKPRRLKAFKGHVSGLLRFEKK